MTETRREVLRLATAGLGLALTPLAAACQTRSAILHSTDNDLGEGELGDVIYHNAFRSADDIKDWRVEGSAHITAQDGLMVMENARPPEDGQEANFVHWCPVAFPADFEATWRFRPIREPGLCVFFFGTKGMLGDDLVSPFDPRIKPRQGVYAQYIDSDIQYLSVSYFRRRWESERSLHLSNLRYAPGFELLATGPDPIPCVHPDNPMQSIKVRRLGRRVTFFIGDLKLLDWTAPDDRPMPGGGYMGFRQMAPLKAEYADFSVRALRAG